MRRVPDLSRRIREPELMDDPSLDPREHRRALASLSRLNRTWRAAAIVWNAIKPLATTPGHGTVSILDIATGSADIPLGLSRLASRAGVTLEIHACDISEVALGEARRRIEQAGARIATSRIDALVDEYPDKFDVVMCSLFTHHLENDQVVNVLYRMRAAAQKLVLVSDLLRSRAAYRMVVAATRVFSRNRIVRVDAERSIRAAFTIPEFAALAEEAGLTGADVSPRWPCRFLLTWRRER